MSNEILIGTFEIGEAKGYKRELEEKGISIDLRANEQTCTKGCKVIVELWGDAKDVEALSNFFSDLKMKQLEGHDINLELLNEVYDPNAEEVTCQACGAKFSPTLSECPECGLFYG